MSIASSARPDIYGYIGLRHRVVCQDADRIVVHLRCSCKISSTRRARRSARGRDTDTRGYPGKTARITPRSVATRTLRALDDSRWTVKIAQAVRQKGSGGPRHPDWRSGSFLAQSAPAGVSPGNLLRLDRPKAYDIRGSGESVRNFFPGRRIARGGRGPRPGEKSCWKQTARFL